MRRVLAIWMVLILLCACTARQDQPLQPTRTASSQAAAKEQPAARQRMQCLYYEEEQFYQGISAPGQYAVDGNLFGGMVPHHLLATDMIAGFFSLAEQNKGSYERIILVAPSHFPENCQSDVVTASAGWDTPFGRLEQNEEMVSAILENQLIAAEDNPSAVQADHGIGGLIPYVAYYLPDVRVGTVLLSNKLSQERLREVGGELAELCGDGRTLLVVSVDCSHYLMPEEASRNDVETARAIEEYDFEVIRRFTDNNVDSPQSLFVLLTAAQRMELSLKRLDHSSSAEKLPHALSNQIYYEGITTYYVYAAYSHTSS